MKELIEKIRKFHNKFSYYDESLEQVISIIQEQESKPFNPLKINENFTTGLISDNIFFSLFLDGLLYKGNRYDLLFIELNKDTSLYTISLEFFEEKELNGLSLIENIKIPNHRFGVELLQNLGVIE